MNRKQKLIISITGITIVLLALLGLTYAYYLTRIQGNTNSNSISITTADLKLTYRDGTGELIANNIMPGNEISSKTFTVKNEGQDVESYTVALINIMNNFTFKDDLEVSVSCSSNINGGVCEGFAEDYEDNIYKEKYPAVNSELFSLGIKEGETHTFTLKVKYLYQEFDQSDDMGKTLKGKVQIYDPKDTIEVSGEVTGASEGDYAEIHSDVQTSEIVDGKYKFVGVPADNHTIYIKNRKTNSSKSTTLEIKKGTTESTTNGVITFTDTSEIANVTIDATNTNLNTTINKVSDGRILLADEVISNAKKNISGRTIYSETPLTTPSSKASEENEMTLSKSEDDYGDSYYFRGNVIDNYVNFAGMCWRIVRIAGDNSIKLILEDQYVLCNDTSTTDINNDEIIYTGNYIIGTGTFGYHTVTKSTDSSKTSQFLNYLESEESGMADSFENFQKNKLNKYTNYLKVGDWCYDYETDEQNKDDYIGNETISYFYHSYDRINNNIPTLKCEGSLINKFSDGEEMYVGTLTAEETVFAGSIELTHNTTPVINYYLINSSNLSETTYWATISPSRYSASYLSETFYAVRNVQGSLTNSGPISGYRVGFRPAINLREYTIIEKGGDGTQSNPYVIK